MKGGEEYALDICGAQYGYYDPVVLWDTYKETRIQCIQRTHGFGHWHSKISRLGKGSHATWEGPVRELNDKCGHVCSQVVVAFDEKVAISKMLKMPKEEYSKAKQKMLAHVDTSIRQSTVYWKVLSPEMQAQVALMTSGKVSPLEQLMATYSSLGYS